MANAIQANLDQTGCPRDLGLNLGMTDFRRDAVANLGPEDVDAVVGLGRRDTFRPVPDDVDECCTIVANPELLGVTGRVVVDAPEGVYDFGVEVFQAGTRVRNWYGNAVVDLLPGDYDITLNGVLVTGVKVNRQMDTTIRSGALSVNLTDDSGWGYMMRRRRRDSTIPTVRPRSLCRLECTLSQ